MRVPGNESGQICGFFAQHDEGADQFLTTFLYVVLCHPIGHSLAEEAARDRSPDVSSPPVT
jgi:hypothetical protein